MCQMGGSLSLGDVAGEEGGEGLDVLGAVPPEPLGDHRQEAVEVEGHQVLPLALRHLEAVEDGGEDVAEELGDLLFAAVNVARFVKVDPEDALSIACDKFARRFRQVEASAAAQGKTLEEMTLAEMDRLWDEAKKQEA